MKALLPLLLGTLTLALPTPLAGERDRFGGSDAVRTKATGFFRTEEIAGRWWLITPEGNAFFSKGVNHVSFSGDHSTALGYSPYGRAVQARYGSAEKWAAATAVRLRSWGLNTVGAWSSAEMFTQRIPYTVILGLADSAGADWQRGEVADVFAPRFEQAVRARARELCAARAQDPFLLGYFTDNELRWGADWRSKKSLFEEFLGQPADRPGRQALIRQLRARYATVAAFNEAWGTQFGTLEELDAAKSLPMGSEAAKQAQREFVGAYARAYFKACHEAIQAADPNHLILGCRFAGYYLPETVAAMREFCDLVSYNHYGFTPPAEQLRELHRITGRPVMLTEFSFKAMDSGLPNTRGAGKPVATQQDRADHFDRYVTALARMPFVVGYHWFEHADEPAEGRFDGENSNYGLVNGQDDPWVTLVERVTQVNARLEEDHLAASQAGASVPAALPPIRDVPKPADTAVERRAHAQATLPDGVTEVPFEETAPEPVLRDTERERGYLLFQRPLTESVHPNARPLDHERLEALVGFATPGEFEPFTFAIYPVRPLQNLRVRVSPLRSSSGEIPSDRLEVRLATYWNVGYPSYTSLKTYRRVPELLERVTVHSSPAGECQWYWLTVHVPDDAKPGLYQATVTLWDEGYRQAVEIPLALRVLGFRLQKDPQKHFSAYFYVRNRALYRGRDEGFIRRAADRDYQAMTDFGLDMLPTLYLRCEDGQRIVLSEADELERMLAAGLKGPAPVTADSVIARIYRDTTPEGKRENHWRVNPLPPPAFYERVTELFRAFEAERKAKGWPEFVCCPIDEVDPSCKTFGAGVYAAVKKAGLRTYATKDPVGADAADYAPHLDVWCSQPYSVPYERIVAQNRYEYWCYPNHNAGEIKDRWTMCKGGRMTYGFGLWRSGYTTLIPWHWCWPSEPDPFDYLRGRFSGCGQRVDDDGDVIPAVYWACFREGYDDARYLYTLQQAIVQREASTDPACVAALTEGRRLLQETWDAIRVQPRYLADGMWPSEEFDAVRWRLAMQTSRLIQFPATGTAAAPSVLVATSSATRRTPEVASPYEAAARAGTLETLDLGGAFADWKNGTREGRTEVVEAARHSGARGLRWTVEIDHRHDGGEGGNYPVGWPRLAREFGPGQLDLSRYDTLEFWIRTDSNRDEVADDHTRIGLVISAHGRPGSLYSTTTDLGDTQRTWVPLRFPIRPMMAAAEAGEAPWKSISRVQLFLSEHDYADGTRLTFDLGEVSLLRLTAPAIAQLDAPRLVVLPRRTLAFTCELIGIGTVAKGSHTLAATLEGVGGAVRGEARQDLTAPPRLALALPALEPGNYTLRLTIRDGGGKTCSEQTQALTALPGPLF